MSALINTFKTSACLVFIAVVLCMDASHANEMAFTVSSASIYDKSTHDALLLMLNRSTDRLDAESLHEFKHLLADKGWPTVVAVGRDGVDAAGKLLFKSSSDYTFQRQILDLMLDSRLSVDVSPLGYARLSDEIENQHAGAQRYATLLSIKGGKVTVDPAIEKNSATTYFRDFNGLPTTKEQIASVQKLVDSGEALSTANPFPPLSQPYKPYTAPDVRRLLGEMIDPDQASRHALDKATSSTQADLVKRAQEVDKENYKKLKEIFSKYGFPTVAMVGRDGVSDAFLLVQHADNDPAFQRQALLLAKPLMERRELPKQEYALLTDRVLSNEGKPQIYGTQADIVNGKIVVKTVQDYKNLDERRENMGLPTEEKYIEILRKQFSDSIATSKQSTQK
jgi:hypothetical protein